MSRRLLPVSLPVSLLALLGAFAAVRGGHAVADGPASTPLPPPVRPPAAGPSLFDLLPAASRPTYAYLVHLGWRVVEDVLPGWRIEFLPSRPGYRGSTFPDRQLIQIYQRSNLTVADYVHVTAHELGHAIDVTLLDGGALVDA